MRILIITAVARETDAIGRLDDDTVVRVGGIGRTNAAAATTEAILSGGPFDAVISAGVAGVLPDGALDLGDTVVASACVYMEEGIATPDGFEDLRFAGLALGDFEGNAVPVDPGLLATLEAAFRTAPIATVATCSGTDAAAAAVRERTAAVAEAMEGAAVVHAARRLGVAGIELRTISNTTGERSHQRWDLAGALDALGTSTRHAIDRLRSGASYRSRTGAEM